MQPRTTTKPTHPEIRALGSPAASSRNRVAVYSLKCFAAIDCLMLVCNGRSRLFEMSCASAFLMQCLRCFQHIFGRRPDAEIFRYIHRSHDTRGIQQELVWASYIMGVKARSGMQKVKAPDDLRIGIGEK